MSGATKTILAFSANPGKTLDLEVELREIRTTLEKKGVVDFNLKVSPATRLEDFHEQILRHRPAYIHFCGHADGQNGLILENDNRAYEFVKPETLDKFFGVFADNFPIDCVVLNACTSEPQAEAIAKHVGYVVSMQTPIGDDEAIQFSKSFYSTLINGIGIKDAFQIACAELVNFTDETKPKLIHGRASLGPSAYNGEPLSPRIEKYGLVDLALRREELTWKYLSKTLDDLINNMPEQSEFFIVARSLELWTKPPKNGGGTFLEKLAEKVVSHQLRVTFVLPDEDPKLKSLVLSDPSQQFQKDLWDGIKTTLENIIEYASGQGNNDLESGYLEIYTIPAYVPSTFSRIETKDGIEYCSLEVGIGIPPDDDRVFLYFVNKKGQSSIFDRLVTIHRGIIAERKPKYKFPKSKDREPEDKELLSKVYQRIGSDFIEKGFNYAGVTQNKDWFQKGDEDTPPAPFQGEAACITSLPLSHYIGGRKLLDTIAVLRAQCDATIAQYGGEAAFAWLSDEFIHIPVFYYKANFNGRSTALGMEEANKLIECISSYKPFHIVFKHFAIDALGQIMLLGYVNDEGTLKDKSALQSSLSDLRDKLLYLSKIEFKHFEARRPQIICCVIGTIRNVINRKLQRDLQTLVNEKFDLPPDSISQIEIDQLRLVKFKGNYAKYSVDDAKRAVYTDVTKPDQLVEEPLQPIILKTELLEKERGGYGILTTGKWLGHVDVVEKIKHCAFDEVTPVSVHFSPSLSCNYHCPTCSYGCSKEEKHPSSEVMMSREDLLTSIKKLAKSRVKGVIFTGGGEPLMNRYTTEGMKLAKQRGLSVGLFTNGSRLEKNVSEELLSDSNEEPDFIRISINAGTPEAYRLIHGSDQNSFGKVLKNLEALCRVKQNHKSKTNIDIGVLITPAILDNLVDLAIEIKRIAIKYPGVVNNMLIRPAINYVRGNRNNKYAGELQSNAVYGVEYKRFLQSSRQFDQDTFNAAIEIINKQVLPLFKDGPASMDVALPEDRFKNASRTNNALDKCRACNLVVFVAPDTRVYRCVERALEPDPELSLGYLRDVAELNDLWKNGKPDTSKIATKDCPPVCLLYETNIVWRDISIQYSNPQSAAELAHRLDLAKEYFDRYASPKVAHLINFI